MKKLALMALLGLSCLAFGYFQDLVRKKPPEGAAVYFITPQDGDVVEGPVVVKFGLKGMGVAPAGILKENTGHHHILVDARKMPDMNLPIPMTDEYRHFGGGQTETVLDLKPGKHTLQLLLADELHLPHDPAIMSKKITITVKK